MRPEDFNQQQGQDNSAAAAEDPAFAAGEGSRRPEVIERVAQGAHRTIDQLADRAAPPVQRLQASMAGTSEKLHMRSGQWRETGEEWTESLRTAVRENPLGAIATAFVVGMVIARLR